MKSITKLAVFILCLIISQHTIAQADTLIHYFKEIGWTIQVPADFTILDSASRAANMAAGKGAIEKNTNSKIDISHVKTFISAVKDNSNNFSANYTYSTTITADNYDSADHQSKALLLSTFTKLIPTATVDTNTTVRIISGLTFRWFRADLTIDVNTVLHVNYISRRLREHPFSFFYFYLDPAAGKEIEAMLNNSTFDK